MKFSRIHDDLEKKQTQIILYNQLTYTLQRTTYKLSSSLQIETPSVSLQMMKKHK